MNELTHLDLFSGIAGFSLGLESVGFRTVAFCEFDAERQRDLRHHWPGVPIVSDVNDVDALGRALTESGAMADAGHGTRGSKQGHEQDEFASGTGGFSAGAESGPFILTAGVPCQPASSAGKRGGSADDRWLWPQTLRVVERFQPRWCVFENPLGIASLALPAAIPGVDLTRLREVPGRTIAEILTRLAALGYELPCDRDGIPWIPVVPAAGVGAFHGRDRLFIIARRRDVGHAADAGSQGHGHECNGWNGGCERVTGTAGATVGDAEGLQPRQGSEQRAGAGFAGTGGADEALPRLINFDSAGHTIMEHPAGERRGEGRPEHAIRSGRDTVAGPSGLPDWSDARIERGADGIWRATQPGIRLLASRIPRRISQLRGYGNAVCPQVVAQIGKAILEIERGH